MPFSGFSWLCPPHTHTPYSLLHQGTQRSQTTHRGYLLDGYLQNSTQIPREKTRYVCSGIDINHPAVACVNSPDFSRYLLIRRRLPVALVTLLGASGSGFPPAGKGKRMKHRTSLMYYSTLSDCLSCLLYQVKSAGAGYHEDRLFSPAVGTTGARNTRHQIQGVRPE